MLLLTLITPEHLFQLLKIDVSTDCLLRDLDLLNHSGFAKTLVAPLSLCIGAGGPMQKTLQGSVCVHKGRNIHSLFVRFIKMCVHIDLFLLIPANVWMDVDMPLISCLHTNTSVCSTMKKTAKKNLKTNKSN